MHQHTKFIPMGGGGMGSENKHKNITVSSAENHKWLKFSPVVLSSCLLSCETQSWRNKHTLHSFNHAQTWGAEVFLFSLGGGCNFVVRSCGLKHSYISAWYTVRLCGNNMRGTHVSFAQKYKWLYCDCIEYLLHRCRCWWNHGWSRHKAGHSTGLHWATCGHSPRSLSAGYWAHHQPSWCS